jgi:hypothetical protein
MTMRDSSDGDRLLVVRCLQSVLWSAHLCDAARLRHRENCRTPRKALDELQVLRHNDP